jgi:outer membrane protein insertion porin family
VLLRELPLRPGALYSKKQVEKIPERLNRLGLLKSVSDPVIVMKGRRHIGLLIEIEEGNSTSFDGVVGYIPGESAVAGNEGYFTGLVDLSLNNLFGTGRQFSVYWKKPDRLSEEFSLGFREPWVMGYPLDVGVGLDRTVRDSAFIEWQYELNTRLRIRENFYLVSRLHRRIALPDSASSRTQRLTRNAVLNGEIGVEYDSRYYPINPRDGIFYRNTYSYGLKENFGPSYLLDEDQIKKNERVETIHIEFEWFQRIAMNQVLSLQLTGYKISGGRLQLTDFFWFGGSRSLRGYRENQFRGNVVAWANLEYRFLLNRNSRLFVFNDWGFYQDIRASEKTDHTLPGYGIGIRLDTGLGIMGIDYGLGRGDTFSQGKIHFGIINRF